MPFQNLLITPAEFPSLAKAEEYKSQKLRNALAQQELSNYPEKMRLGMESAQLQNKLLQQQVEINPSLQKAKELKFQLQQDLFDLEKKAFEATKGEKVTSQIKVGEDTYEVSGRSQDVAEVAGTLGKHIDQLDQNAIPWAANKGVGIKKVSNKESRPVGMPAWYDSMGVEKMGSQYDTPQGRKEFADWVKTPEGKAEAAAYRQKYAKESATPFYNVMQTAEGFVPMNARTGQPEPSTGLGKPLPSEQIVAEQQIGTLSTTLGRVEKSYDEKFVGPVGGRYGELKGKWIGLNEKQAMFYADVTQLKNTLIYLMSGKQINESEYERLKDQLPSADLPASTFKARMKAFRKTLESIIEERRKNQGGYGPRGKEASAEPKSEKPKVTRESAIAELQKRGKIVNEDTIKKAMELLGAE